MGQEKKEIVRSMGGKSDEKRWGRRRRKRSDLERRQEKSKKTWKYYIMEKIE